MVNEMPGTTRDTVDVLLQWHKQRFRIVDTAGMRRPGRVARGGEVEAVSVVLAKRAMERADVVVLVVDATEGAGDREGAIAGEAEEAGCGIVIAVNKWDLVKGRGQDLVKAFDDKLRFQLKFLDYAPLVHLSALTGDRTPKLLEMVDRVAVARQRRVPTAELNRFLEAVTAAHPPVEQDAARGADSLRRADGHGAAVVRAVHERGDGAALLVRALPDEPAAGVVRLRGVPDSSQGPAARRARQKAVGPEGKRPKARRPITVILNTLSHTR